MKVLTVHPSGLMYSKVFLRLEPLGLELVAQAIQDAGHQVRLIDLLVENHDEFFRTLNSWQPDVIAFSCNYLANIPEIIDLAKAAREKLPSSFIFVGGHSASFTAEELLNHANGAIDCILKGEGEASVAELLEAVQHDRKALVEVPGTVSEYGYGPAPVFIQSLDDLRPARDLLKYPRRYYIGILDPAASIEFSRGCPWDCAFCSAWTFYGRSYRLVSPEKAVEELENIKQPGVFIVDDVAFLHAKHGFEIGEQIARKGIKKQYYIETRVDVLLRNKEVFKFWKQLGLVYMFLGFEAIDSDGLERYRKRVTLDKNLEALEFARSLGIDAAINIIADPEWDHERFELIRQWSLEIPEIVNISIFTPYPGTETWYTESRRLTTQDYRLFDIQHCVLPTKMPLAEYYREIVKTQQVVNQKFLGWKGLYKLAPIVGKNLLRGQTNFARLFWKFDGIYKPERMLADHERPIKYKMQLPPPVSETVDANSLYVHTSQGRKSRALDDAGEDFVNQTRQGNSD